jgi:hypothetical protein
MKRIVRLTEADLTRIVRRVISEDKRKKLNEGIGTGLLVLSGIGVLYLGRKLKKFIDKYAKFMTSARLGLFLSKVNEIEDGKEDGKIVVKESGDYKFIYIVIDGEVFDSITIDMENDSIYGGHSKKPKKSDMIIPKVLPYDADTKDMEKIEQAEEVLVDSILGIISKYAKKTSEKDMDSDE